MNTYNQRLTCGCEYLFYMLTISFSTRLFITVLFPSFLSLLGFLAVVGGDDALEV